MTSESALVALLLALSLCEIDRRRSRRSAASAARIGVLFGDFCQAEECVAEADPRALRGLQIDGEPERPLLDEEMRDPSELGELVQIAHRQHGLAGDRG